MKSEQLRRLEERAPGPQSASIQSTGPETRDGYAADGVHCCSLQLQCTRCCDSLARAQCKPMGRALPATLRAQAKLPLRSTNTPTTTHLVAWLQEWRRLLPLVLVAGQQRVPLRANVDLLVGGRLAGGVGELGGWCQ